MPALCWSSPLGDCRGRRGGRLASWSTVAVALTAALTACQRPPDAATDDVATTSMAGFSIAAPLIGTWRWVHVLDEPTLRRTEREEWRWLPSRDPGAQLRGRYLREVTVRSSTLPFACNQRTEYQQRAVFDVEAQVIRGEILIRETSYQTEPSPCDHGFRRLGTYRARVHRGRADLTFPDGAQSLWQVDDSLQPLEPPPWTHDPPTAAGAWTWSNDSVDAQGLSRHEEERWSLALPSAAAPGPSTRLEAIYVRRVTIRSPDGSIIPCAGAPSYGFEDRYVLASIRRGEQLELRETAVAAGDHACLRERSGRALDTATVEVIGQSLVLEWRGKRRQVLHRAP